MQLLVITTRYYGAKETGQTIRHVYETHLFKGNTKILLHRAVCAVILGQSLVIL